MNKPKFNNEQHKKQKGVPTTILIFAITIQALLTGCASFDRKDESIDAILVKENTLIQKVKLERAQPEVTESLQQSDALKKAEAHLVMSLDEIMRANNMMIAKLLKQTEMEVELERNQRASH